MSQLVPAKSLQPAPAAEASTTVAKMFAALLSPKGGDLSKAFAAEYLEAIRFEPIWAIQEVAWEYRTGRMGDGKFAPLPAEFGKQVRERSRRERDRQAQDKAIREQIEARRAFEACQAAKTPEARERVRLAHERFKKHLKVQREESDEDKERQALRADMIQRLHARFDDEAIATRSSQGRAV
jgi:hypothetical protein